jgi:hypothetical protein
VLLGRSFSFAGCKHIGDKGAGGLDAPRPLPPTAARWRDAVRNPALSS